MRRIISDEELKWAIDMHRQRWTLREIAAALYISLSSLQYDMEAEGYHPRQERAGQRLTYGSGE